MKDKLQQIREKAIAEIEGSDGLERLNEVRQAVLGKKGELTAVLKGMKDVAPEDRPKVGQWVNDTRSAIETVLEEKMKKLEADALKKRYAMSELFIIEIYSSAVYFLLIFILLFKLGQFFYLRLSFVEILVAERDELRPLFKELQ